MKKIILSIIFALIIQYPVLSQGCLPGGITFNTQEEIDRFKSNYPGCTEIEGYVTISGSDEITNLQGLDVLTRIGGRLRFYTCTVLTSLSGLENITSIGGDLDVYFWPSTNSVLTNLTGLDNLTTIGGGLTITNVDALTSLSGLEKLTSIGGDLEIGGNDALTNLSGLDYLASIGGGLWIGENMILNNLNGLENLMSIGENFELYYSNLSNLNGLNSLSFIGGDLKINYSQNLSSLSGLSNLTSIGGYIEIYYNDVLNSLSGLDNIEAGSITDIYIEYNSSLSTCEVKCVCDFLASPNGDIDISHNASGCNNESEVGLACEALSVENANTEPSLSLFPNPAKNVLFILGGDESTTLEINIYNLLGQRVLNEKGKTRILDISELKKGIYMIELTSNDFKIIKKLILE